MAWYVRLRGTPALMFPRGGAVIDASYKSRFTCLWVKFAFSGAKKILCQGLAWQRFVVNLIGFRKEDAPIVTSWTATPELIKLGNQRLFNLEDRPVRLLFLGWLEEKKGIFELLEACRYLSKSRQFVLDIVGDGAASELAIALVQKYGLVERVNFTGWLKGERLNNAISKADVFVLPSWAEGLPNAMIEAMAAKLAVVITTVGNIPDIVTDGKEALLVPPQDVLSLTTALAKVIDSPGLRRRLGEAAFSLAKNRWSVEPAVERLLSAVRASTS